MFILPFLREKGKPFSRNSKPFYVGTEMKIKKSYLVAGGVTAIFALLAVLFGLYDLNITLSVVHMENRFGMALEYLGVLIAPFLAMYFGTVICVYYYKSSNTLRRIPKLIAGILVVLASICYCCYIYSALSNLESLAAVILTGILWMVSAVWLLMQSCDALYEQLKIAWTAVIYIAFVLIVINLLKACWGRVRFREMENDFALFTPWYLPQGFTGHTSFPSGHTANAASLYVITCLLYTSRCV